MCKNWRREKKGKKCICKTSCQTKILKHNLLNARKISQRYYQKNPLNPYFVFLSLKSSFLWSWNWHENRYLFELSYLIFITNTNVRLRFAPNRTFLIPIKIWRLFFAKKLAKQSESFIVYWVRRENLYIAMKQMLNESEKFFKMKNFLLPASMLWRMIRFFR